MMASDVMTRNVSTVRTDARIEEAIATMLAHRISGLPVLNAKGRLAGILTEGDLLRRSEIATGPHRPAWLEFLRGPGRAAADYVRVNSRRVEDVMTREVATVAEHAPLAEVVALMTGRHVKRVPVLRGDELVGIVSRADLVRALGQVLAESAGGGATDEGIEGRLRADLKKQPWFVGREISFTVEEGRVTLEGTISDERLRTALRVAAENVPGVAAVEDNLIWVDPMTLAETGM